MLLEPSLLKKAGAAPRRREAERPAISDGMRHRQRREPQAKAAGNSNSPFARSSTRLGAEVRPGSEKAA
jgi:hypothetical protein